MVCPKCLHKKTSIYNSRSSKRTNQTWRRRQCASCGYNFTTREFVEAGQLLTIVTTGGSKEPYSRTKLLLKLAEVCNHLENYYENIELLIETMEYKLLHIANGGLVSAQTVTEVLLEVLQNFDMKAYLKLVTALGDIYDNRDIKRLLKKKQS